MNDAPIIERVNEDAVNTSLAEMVALYDRGQYADAYRLGCQRLGPIETWPGVSGRIFAGRLAHNLGAPRWGQAWHWRTCRAFPDHPDLLYYRYSLFASRRGPIAAWRQFYGRPFPEGLSERQRAELLGLRAHVQALLRDFDAAERDIAEALRLAPDHVWILVDQHAVLAAMDRREEALEATSRALAVRPFYRPAVQCHAYQLVQLNRDDEAVDLLRRGAEYNQSGDLWSQLVAFYWETEQFALAEECLARAESAYLLVDRDKATKKWLAGRQSDLAYRRGDYAEAIRLAEQVDTPFFKSVTASLRESLAKPEKENRRIQLKVHFVRQHHLTCAPATLCALSGYWGRPVDHIELAETICYDGTPAHEERHWANEQGYVTREFRVTWDNARKLIERGIPFTLTTVSPQSGHLQPVIGFDERRGVLLVRDPGERHHAEYRAQELLEHFSSSGPRGMAMVPAEQETRLADLELEDAPFYDAYYALQRALRQHDRAAAAAQLETMRTWDPQHRLTLVATATLAWYDQDRVRQLQAVEVLAARFPKDVNQQLARLSLLRELGRKSERLGQLRELSEAREADPIYWRLLAEELINDQRTLGEAWYWICRLMKRRQSGEDLRTLSHYYWRVGDRCLAIQVMRLAALSESRDESLSSEYFTMARSVGETDEAMAFLWHRHRALGAKSAGPTYTLAWALDSCDRYAEAAQVLEEGCAMRPTDGDAILNRAHFLIGWGKPDEVRELLRQAEPISNRVRWMQTAARLAMLYDDLETQERWYREILKLQPLNVGFVRALFSTISGRQGIDAACEFLESYVATYPEHYDLRQMWIMELRRETQWERALAEVDRMLEYHPDDPWSLREKALLLLEFHRGPEAEICAEAALQVEPNVAASWSVRGQVLEKMGRRAEAIAAYREALRVSIDWEIAFEHWMNLCETREERLQLLEFVRSELKSQVVMGDLLPTLVDHVQPTLDDEAALALFRDMYEARPDLLQSGLALAEMLRRKGLLDEAQKIIDQTTARFELVPRVWLAAAALASDQGDQARQIECHRRALAINPRWPQAIYGLALALQQADRGEEAIEVLQKCLMESPRDAIVRCALAEVYWQQKRTDEAIHTMAEVVRQQPDFNYAWDCLQNWVTKLERPELIVEAARQLAEKRPNEIYSWTLLADVYPETREYWPERFKAVLQALAINPLATDVLRRKAELLAEKGDFDEAIATCQTQIHGRPCRVLQLCELDLRANYRSLEEAAERLKVILKDDPDSAGLWHRLADWSEKTGDWEEYHRASEQLVRTAPGHAISWGYRGDSLVRQGKKEEAIASFEKALQLDPTYEFAFNQLLDLYFNAQRLEEARRLLDRVRRHLSEASTDAAEIRLHVAHGQLEQAMIWFQRLMEGAGLYLGTKLSAIRMMIDHGCGERAEQLLWKLMSSRDLAELGYLWGWSATLRGKQAVAAAFKRLRSMKPATPAWHEACQCLLSSLDSHGEKRWGDKLIKSRWQDLKQEHGSWSAAAEYLLDARSEDFGNGRRMKRWIAYWNHRCGLTSYQWFQVVRVAASLRDWKMLRAISARALNELQAEADANGELIRLWYAMALMQDGDWDKAAEQVAMFRDFQATEYYEAMRRFLRRIDQAIGELVTAGENAPPAALRQNLDRLTTEVKSDMSIQRLFTSPVGAAWKTIQVLLRQRAKQPVPWWVQLLRKLGMK